MATAGPSTGVAEDLSLLEELLQCPICLETVTAPKKLQCDHIFCETCLQDLCASGPSRHLRCPTCRTETSVPANGVAGLPNDFRANELKDTIGKIARNRPRGNVSNPSQAQPRDDVCNLCQARNQVVPATWRCIHCEMMYCEGCMVTHDSNSLFKRHEIRRLHKSIVTWGMCEVRMK